jgi:hypothetical protein
MPKALWEELNKRPRVVPLPTPDTSWNANSNAGSVKYLDYHEVKYRVTVPNHRPSYKPPPIGKAMEALDKALSEATSQKANLKMHLFGTRAKHATSSYARIATSAG